jgi:flagellar hook-basal body complex protein FliE
MSQMQIDQVLAQIRSLAGSGGIGGNRPVAPGAGQAAVSGPAFGDLLRKSLDSVNASQANAATLADNYERGVGNVDLATVMIESQKATVSFRALTEVRNRLVNVYQDIMNMPI